MRFLRSVVADARPRQSGRTPSITQTATTSRSRGLDGAAPGTEETARHASDHTTRLPPTGGNDAAPMFGRNGAGDAGRFVSHETATPVATGDQFRPSNPVRTGRDLAEGPVSVTMDGPARLSSEQSHVRPDSESDANRESDSDRNAAFGADANTNTATTSDGAVFTDGQINASVESVFPPMASQTPDTQHRVSTGEQTQVRGAETATGITSANTLTDDDRYVSPDFGDVAGPPPMREVVPTFSGSDHPTRRQTSRDTSADTRYLSAESAGESAGDSKLSLFDADATPATKYASDAHVNRVDESESAAARNKAAHGLNDDAKARQPSPRIGAPASVENAANRAETALQQKPDAKGIVREVQRVFVRETAVDGNSSEAKPASVLQPVGRSTSDSRGSVFSGPSKPPQENAGPATPSESSPPLRSVPARPWPADLTSTRSDPVRPSVPLRPAGKRHEAPGVQIGRIDVIVEAAARPARKPAPASAPSDLASRHYLRSL